MPDPVRNQQKSRQQIEFEQNQLRGQGAIHYNNVPATIRGLSNSQRGFSQVYNDFSRNPDMAKLNTIYANLPLAIANADNPAYHQLGYHRNSIIQSLVYVGGMSEQQAVNYANQVEVQLKQQNLVWVPGAQNNGQGVGGGNGNQGQQNPGGVGGGGVGQGPGRGQGVGGGFQGGGVGQGPGRGQGVGGGFQGGGVGQRANNGQAAGAAAAGLNKPAFGSSYIESAKALLRAVLSLMVTGAGNNNPFCNIAKMLAGKSMVEVAKTLTEAGMTDEVVNGNPMLRHEALLVDTQAAGLRGIFETAIQYWNQTAQANKQIEKDTHQLAQRA